MNFSALSGTDILKIPKMQILCSTQHHKTHAGDYTPQRSLAMPPPTGTSKSNRNGGRSLVLYNILEFGEICLSSRCAVVPGEGLGWSGPPLQRFVDLLRDVSRETMCVEAFLAGHLPK